jgi:6-phosphogluconolactonase
MNLSIKRAAILAIIATMASAVTVSASLAATVYTETNSASGNAVQVYRTMYDGSLTLQASVPTGGAGTDGGLGNQGAIALTRNGRWLFAVNAGSNEIRSFVVTHRGLRLVDKVSSGGTQPISLTVHDDLLYVLNAGGGSGITGFYVLPNGRLTPIPQSTRPLSPTGAGPAQVSFDHDGDALVVSEKASNSFSVYSVEDDVPSDPTAQPSNGQTPFGFAFDRRDTLLVSEAFGGAAGASALSSYDLDEDPLLLDTISASVPTSQTAACWVALARHGRFAYVTNTGSGSVTGFRVDRTGSVTLLNANGVTGITGGSPIDAAVSRDQHTLFVLTPNTGKITAFRVRPDGSLINLGVALGVAGSATGLAAR